MVLTACAGPRPAPPPDANVTIPTGWQRGAAQMETGALTPAWWSVFGSSVLNDLVEQALAHNSDVLASASRVSQAEAELNAVRGQSKPSVGLGLGGDRERQVNAFGQPQMQRAWSAQFQASYEVDIFGRMASASASARAALASTRAVQASVRLSVGATVARAYIDLLVQHETLSVAQQTLQARLGSKTVAQRRWDAGYGSELELRQAESEYENAAALVPATRLAIAKDEDLLAELTGKPPSPIAIHEHLGDIRIPRIPLAIPSQVLRQRPDVIAAEDTVVAADRALDEARAEFMPSVSLMATGGYVGSTLLASPVKVFTVGTTALAPLFEGGRLHAQADRAASLRDQAAFAYRRAALSAFAEVEDALAASQQYADREQALTRQQDATAAAYSLARNRFREGYADYLEQLDAERALLGAQLAALEGREARLDASVALIQAVGGGWNDAAHSQRPPAGAP
ncbi:efflux transporter, outer membrane factor (OMF) lipoprotein, NodT family [Luteibacter sp. UNCMF366Tsu5.1]|nr:efflux transporter outer membrane subunit [Luteibacter sp. UNCMF366Tsu5.1]SFW29635.1 efflux transporter, outer membrane factor (OMF) lipoprotein, NodT family [Luteibacter sp. UNCMF366Tsu5.1]